MNIIYLSLLCLGLLQPSYVYSSTSQMNYNHNIRNLGFKIIIFKEKKYPKLVDYIKSKCQIYYEKTIATIGEGLSEYENLSYEDKLIIDFILSINNLN
jgi:hypothetical protein